MITTAFVITGENGENLASADNVTFFVICDDYTSKHKTREAAERRLAEVEAAGFCANKHRIEER